MEISTVEVRGQLCTYTITHYKANLPQKGAYTVRNHTTKTERQTSEAGFTDEKDAIEYFIAHLESVDGPVTVCK
jgi:hypothetical protein